MVTDQIHGQGNFTDQRRGMSVSSNQALDELDLDAEYHSNDSQASVEFHRGLKPKSSELESESFEMSDVLEPSKPSSFSQDFRDEEGERGSEEESPIAFRHAQSDDKSVEEKIDFYTPDEEKSVIKTFDRRLVLFIALLYMLSFLDRSSKYFLLLNRS